MPRLFDLLSENTDDKTLSSLRKIASKKEKDGREKHSRQNGQGNQGKYKKHDLYESLDFVALDLETTGLDDKTDRIIEIGAVKFLAGHETEEFSTFVNPGIAIPAHITTLTGITSDDVKEAPAFAQVAKKIIDFIGDLPICGHQIDFDVNFLNEEFKRTAMPKVFIQQLDTALLARLVTLPITRYTLKHVAAALGVSLERAHRALDDARASGNIALRLMPKLAELPINLRAVMAHCAPPSIVKSYLFKTLERESYDLDLAPPALPRPPKKLTSAGPFVEIDIKEVEKEFGDGGVLSQVLPGFAPRPSQIQMAAAVADAFNSGACLVAEAGPGTGKSLAYLVPAARFALKNNRRVLVSTHTRNLQDQLIAKDIPIVKKITGGDLRSTVLKGRANYLCRRRFMRLLSGELGDFSYRERMGMLPLIRWAQETKTGDIEEQSQFNIRWFSRLWHSVCADAHFCEGRRCAEFHSCFLQQARQRALGSHLVVINHSLFFSEICAESSFLGRLGPIVFDEAHHIESCGHRHLRVDLDTNRCNAFVAQAANLDKEIKKGGEGTADAAREPRFKPIVKRLRAAVKAFLEAVHGWAKAHEGIRGEYQIEYGAETFSNNADCLGLTTILSELQDEVRLFSQTLEAAGPKGEDRLLSAECLTVSDRTSQLKADLLYLTAAATPDHVFYLEGNIEKGWVKLIGVPLDVGAVLSPLWETNDGACIFTSATLSVAGSMDYFMARVGLAQGTRGATRCERFKSPFSPSQAIRGALVGGPEVDAPDYPAHVAAVAARLLSSFDKNILVLFTANAMLLSVYGRLKQTALPSGCTVLAQGISGNRQAVLDEFKRQNRCVLLGADSFWEGVDVPGKACEIVLIPRLPFPVPTHPLTAALARKREQEKGDSFFSFLVPEAVIRFRQGTGRLIRTSEDKGALIVLDGRIITKGYGRRFSSSLDGPFTSFASLDDMVNTLGVFFKGEKPEGGLTYVPLEEA
jgi:ATP-dependent DNA helicase DinG